MMPSAVSSVKLLGFDITLRLTTGWKSSVSLGPEKQLH
jgi:hypothetical protein